MSTTTYVSPASGVSARLADQGIGVGDWLPASHSVSPVPQRLVSESVSRSGSAACWFCGDATHDGACLARAANDSHARRIRNVLFFTYALVTKIPDVAADNDEKGLHIADWDLAMTAPGEEDGVGANTTRRGPLDASQDDDVSGWPDAEIQSTLTAYFAMLRAELAGQSYVKAAFNREVQAATGRSRGAVEFKFANVSAVLREIGLPYVLGYRPRPNIQGALRPAVKRCRAGWR